MRRVIGTAALAAAVVPLLAGCNTSTLSNREVVVYFSDTATQAEHVAAAHNCAGVAPDVAPEPVQSSSSFASTDLNDVRFRVDKASDKDLSLLYACLEKQPGVKGVDIPDLTN